MATEPDPRLPRPRDPDDEEFAEEMTFAEESSIDPEGFAISEEEDAEGKKSQDAA